MGLEKTIEFAKLVLKLALSTTSFRFVSVGVVSLIFAEAVLFVLVDGLALNKVASAATATELSLLLNFALNDNWTFKRERTFGGGVLARLTKYHVSRIGSALLNIALFAIFAELLLLHHLLAYLLAVIIAFFANFLTSFFWVWRAHLSLKAGRGAERGP